MRHRITGSDAGFLYIEGDSQTSTCTHAVVLGPADESEGPLTRQGLREHLASRLDRVPVLHRSLQHVPGGIGHALLVDDPDFDLDAHVHHAVLAAPGAAADYDAWVADQVAVRLDLDRPLWQVTLLDGLEGGRQALVFGFHHTLADGAGLMTILAELIDDGALARPSPASPRERAPHPRQRPARLAVTTALVQVWRWLGLPLLLVRTILRFRRTRLTREASPVRVPAMAGAAPRTVLNRSADNRRAFAHTSLPLAELRAVRRTAGTTLSDVVLAVVAGALRSYLSERRQLPAESLVVNVPLGHDAPDAAPRFSGNVFCNYYAMLATDVADPRERLAAVAAATGEAKRQLDIQGRDTLLTWLDRIPPRLGHLGAQRMAEKHRSGTLPPDFNVLVSNLRAPEPAWTMHGRVVEQIIFSGPVTDGAGLNLTAVGQGDQVVVAVQANPGAVDAPDELARRLHDALADLVTAHLGPPVADTGSQTPRTRDVGRVA